MHTTGLDWMDETTVHPALSVTPHRLTSDSDFDTFNLIHCPLSACMVRRPAPKRVLQSLWRKLKLSHRRPRFRRLSTGCVSCAVPLSQVKILFHLLSQFSWRFGPIQSILNFSLLHLSCVAGFAWLCHCLDRGVYATGREQRACQFLRAFLNR